MAESQRPAAGRRIVYLDALRCLAIFLVLVLHSNAPVLVNGALYQRRSWYLAVLADPLNRAGVPLFFMLSGFLLLRGPGAGDVRGFYRHHLPKLLVPLAAWNLIYALFRARLFHIQLTPGGFLLALIDRGVSYHLWFIYALVLLYLLCPFLKPAAAACGRGELLLLVCLLSAPAAVLAPLSGFLTVPPGFWDQIAGEFPARAGYFLLGYCLGRWPVGRRAEHLIFALGGASYVLCLAGTAAASSAGAIVLPFENSLSLFQYFIAAALFLLARRLFPPERPDHGPAGPLLAWLSGRAYGVYWVHVLVLDCVTARLPDLAPLPWMALRLALTAAISLALSALIARLPGVRRVLAP